MYCELVGDSVAVKDELDLRLCVESCLDRDWLLLVCDKLTLRLLLLIRLEALLALNGCDVCGANCRSACGCVWTCGCDAVVGLAAFTFIVLLFRTMFALGTGGFGGGNRPCCISTLDLSAVLPDNTPIGILPLFDNLKVAWWEGGLLCCCTIRMEPFLSNLLLLFPCDGLFTVTDVAELIVFTMAELYMAVMALGIECFSDGMYSGVITVVDTSVGT